VKLTTQVFSLTNSSQVTTVGIIERFYSWDQLKRFVAWILRYHANVRKAAADIAKMTNIATRSPNPEIKPLTVDDMLVAEREIVKYVQGRSFQDQLARLNGVNAQNNKATRSLDGPVRKTSPIYKLDPQVRNQLLCFGGRLANAPISDESKHSLPSVGRT
jgi:hypothetical protein